MLHKWDSILLDKDLQYDEELIVILDCDVRKLRNKEIKSMKVQLKHNPVKEATLNREGHARHVSSTIRRIRYYLFPFLYFS